MAAMLSQELRARIGIKLHLHGNNDVEGVVAGGARPAMRGRAVSASSATS